MVMSVWAQVEKIGFVWKSHKMLLHFPCLTHIWWSETNSLQNGISGNMDQGSTRAKKGISSVDLKEEIKEKFK